MKDRLEFDSIEVSFGGHKLLSSIYMVCTVGKITGLLGRNGCGKTTLMKIVFGAMPVDQKSVRVNGRSLGLNYLSERLISYLPQSDLIPPYFTVRKAFLLFGVDERDLLDLFPEVREMMDLKPSEVSGGYLRIFETFLVLKSKGSFCLLDEPFTGLTPLYMDKMKDLISATRSTKGIIVSDHMYKHVTEISDDLYLLANGQTYRVMNDEQLISLGYLGDSKPIA